MAIEPQDIQQKQFSNKMRGYNPVEVDEFLDDVAFEQRRLQDEIDSLRQQLTEAKSRADYFDEMKESLNKSIMVAQDAADKVKISSKREAEFTAKEAQKEAEVVVKDAHRKADGYIGEAAGKAQKVVIATDDLKKQARSFRQKLEVLLESQLQMIKGRDWDNLLSSDELLTIGEIKEAMRNSGALDNLPEDSVHSEQVTEVSPDTPAVEPENQDELKTVVVFPEDYDNENGNPTSEGFHVEPKK
ncbi:DivIVA domain-containing protein [Pediococcus stilesii]|uniref:Cell division initiation protein n=1 Tax=Pediococcus stilesii TaxID=331679 RepID=A0A0R2L5Y1_9LACO|nr:DivIVA domain-containing protein [Pediococcus stilesii]KRN94020.1 cell division initiation protein [Pediococcus stilesii]TLQ04996.1 DivIVA domain-containing protein [Pediococcus stilesii]